MFDEYIERLDKQYSNNKEYHNILNEVYMSFKDKDSLIVAEEIKDKIESYITDYNLIIIFDIYLMFKNKRYFRQESQELINDCLVNNFILIDNKIKLYILGYLVNNNILTRIRTTDEKINEFIKARKDELELAKYLIDRVNEKSHRSNMAIKYFVQNYEENVNIFKVAEYIRNEIISPRDIINLNDSINSIFKNCNDGDILNKILEFVLAIYQDIRYVVEKNLVEINRLIPKCDDRFLENLFIEVCEKIKFNRLMNISENRNLDEVAASSESILYRAAARGKVSKDDYIKLNNYLNKTILSRKRVNKINMNYSYDASEIIKLLAINTNYKVDISNILNKLNIQYYEDYFDNDVLGYSFKLVNYKKASIVINKNVHNAEERQRFTMAHEIGHICSCYNGDVESIDFIYNMNVCKKNESSADNFASSLLLPLNGIKPFVNQDINFDVIKECARKFCVSIEATAIKLIKEVEGSYTFMVFNNDNSEKYRVNSKFINSDEINEDIYSFIKESKSNTKKFVNTSLVDILILGDYKYVIINNIYNY